MQLFIPYVVQPGDSLYFIARMFGCSVETIMAANHLVNPAMIYVGQVLYIPVGQPGQPPVQPPGTFPYVVQPGDTLFFIARRFGTTVEALMQLNQIANPDMIYPGQVIYIPGAAPTTTPPTMPPTTPPPATCGAGTFPYIVQPGDTIFLIARRFGVTEAALLAANPQITNPNLIFPGQLICIPEITPTTPPTTMPPTTMPPMTCPVGSFAYTIKAGDTFFLLAQRFNTTVAAIQALNPGVNPNNLQIGQVICIPQVTPTTMPPVTCPVGSFAYTIKAGDTFFLLAQRFNTTVAAIQALNPGVNPNNLQIGQVICIPQVTPTTMPPVTCPVGSFAYTIKAGDTFFLLAQRFNTTVSAIQALNPGVNPNNLQIGQVICIPQVTPTTMPPVTCPVGSFAYTIKAGDTFFLLAQRFNTTVAAIQALNPGVNPNNLQIGQVICIPQVTPTTMPPVTCPVGSFAYTIKAGDTFFLLAQRFNTTVAAIQALNPGVNPNNLQIGQVICIPQVTPTTMPPMTCPTGSFAYTIKAGDTFFLLAQRFNTTVAAIQALNPGVDPNNLQIGQVICIPQVTPTTMPPTTMPPMACPTGSFAYTIKAGDTFFLLAQRFNTTVAAIQALNPNVNPNNLQIGSTICIPQVSCPAGSFAYTVVAGDTFFFLAQRFNTTVAAIQALNPTVNPNNLQIGTVLCIPQVTPTTMPPMTCPAGSFSYIIKAGDTFFLLAQRFGTTVAAIQALNPTANPTNLQIGSVICIPEAEGSLPPGQCPNGSFSYTIVAGDTFFLLARRFGTTVADIEALNPNADPMNLQIGSKICIPGAPRSEEATAPVAVEEIKEADKVTAARQCPTGSFAYTIQSGDTYFKLAQRFGTTVAAIEALNPGVNPNNLQVGQVICIASGTPTTPPTTMPPKTCPTGSFAYTIKAGDTYFNLAQRFGTTVAAIEALNPGIDPNNLQIGQMICIPGAPRQEGELVHSTRQCPAGSFAYTIKAGDTFFLLAQRFNTTVAAIQALNPSVNPNNLQIGQVICIPQTTPTTMPPTTMPPKTCPAGSFAYTVKAGDTYFTLANRFGTTIAAIQALNPGVDPNNLQIGQVICIPNVPGTTQPPTTQPPASFKYVVQVGDTLFFIARRFGTTVDAILKINPQITDPSKIYPGQVIMIPQPPRGEGN